MSDWTEVELGDVLTLQRGFDLPARERIDGPVPIVSSSGVTGSHNESKVNPPGIVIGRYGSLGQVHWVEKPFWPLNTSLWVKDFKGNDPRFLSYLLRTLTFDGSTASAVPGVNRNHLHTLPVRRPPVSAQRRIAAVLYAFDELIEINERRIGLLEDLAHSVYREWFVRFRFPGHEHARFVDSELGLIPHGWAITPLREVLADHIGGGWGADTPTDKHNRVARVVRGTDIPKARVFDVATCPTRYHTSANVKARWLQDGDIVLEVSGGSKGQPVGRSVLVSNELLAELGIGAICASFCKLLRCDPTKLAPEILAYRIEDAYVSREIETYQVQSTGISNLRFSQLLDSFRVTVPPQSIQFAFGEIVGPMRLLTASGGARIRSLRATRDLLLRRLVTGRLDIASVDLGELLPAEAA